MSQTPIHYAPAPDNAKRQSRLALVGFTLALFVVITMALAFLAKYIPQAYLALLPMSDSRPWIALGVTVIVAWFGAVVFSICGFLQSKRRQGLAVITIVLCILAVGFWSLAINLEF